MEGVEIVRRKEVARVELRTPWNESPKADMGLEGEAFADETGEVIDGEGHDEKKAAPIYRAGRPPVKCTY